MAQLTPFGSFGSAFGGSTGGYRGGSNNPFATPPAGGFDRNLFEQNNGEPALGYYATASNANAPFKNWIESYGTHRQLWDDYQGQFAAKQDPTFAFTDYLKQNDPYERYMAMSPQDRGETPQGALSPFMQLLNL